MQLPVEVQLQSGTFLRTVGAVLSLPSHFGHRVWLPVEKIVLRPSISSPCLSLIQVGTEPYYRLDVCLESPYKLLQELQPGNHLPLRLVASCESVSDQVRQRLESMMGGVCGSWLRLESDQVEAVMETMATMVVEEVPSAEMLPSAALPHLEREETEAELPVDKSQVLPTSEAVVALQPSAPPEEFDIEYLDESYYVASSSVEVDTETESDLDSSSLVDYGSPPKDSPMMDLICNMTEMNQQVMTDILRVAIEDSMIDELHAAFEKHPGMIGQSLESPSIIEVVAKCTQPHILEMLLSRHDFKDKVYLLRLMVESPNNVGAKMLIPKVDLTTLAGEHYFSILCCPIRLRNEELLNALFEAGLHAVDFSRYSWLCKYAENSSLQALEADLIFLEGAVSRNAQLVNLKRELEIDVWVNIQCKHAWNPDLLSYPRLWYIWRRRPMGRCFVCKNDGTYPDYMRSVENLIRNRYADSTIKNFLNLMSASEFRQLDLAVLLVECINRENKEDVFIRLAKLAIINNHLLNRHKFFECYVRNRDCELISRAIKYVRVIEQHFGQIDFNRAISEHETTDGRKGLIFLFNQSLGQFYIDLLVALGRRPMYLNFLCEAIESKSLDTVRYIWNKMIEQKQTDELNRGILDSLCHGAGLPHFSALIIGMDK